ncbi:MAG: hypothetical protein ABSC23_09735 [Bryobacteraceae bacterium]|jgi:hypothetical protein
MKWLLVLLAAGSLGAADGPRLFFSQSFPGSSPAYFQVSLARNGDVEYAEAPNDDDPVRFSLSEGEADEVFRLAGDLGYFTRALESPLKVAFMGTKTLRYEDGDRKNEVKVNYSTDPSAQALLDWFARMGESARDRIDLERAAKYDKLGVDQALLTLQSDMDRKRLTDAAQFLPILDLIAKGESYMHMARQRASEIAEAIRKPKP